MVAAVLLKPTAVAVFSPFLVVLGRCGSLGHGLKTSCFSLNQ